MVIRRLDLRLSSIGARAPSLPMRHCCHSHSHALALVCVHSFWFNVGLAGFGGWLVMAAYLILWVKYIKKFGGEWEEYWPQAIPIATVLAVSSLLAFVVGAWPVWGFLTIPGVFVIFLGVLNLAHFVPV